MTEQYIGWALVVGLALGGALVWFAIGRIPRAADELAPDERRAEAEWLSAEINSRGGVAPVELVDEILELHALQQLDAALDPGQPEGDRTACADEHLVVAVAVLGVDVARAVAPARRVEALRAQSFGGHRLAPIRLPTR